MPPKLDPNAIVEGKRMLAPRSRLRIFFICVAFLLPAKITTAQPFLYTIVLVPTCSNIDGCILQTGFPMINNDNLWDLNPLWGQSSLWLLAYEGPFLLLPTICHRENRGDKSRVHSTLMILKFWGYVYVVQYSSAWRVVRCLVAPLSRPRSVPLAWCVSDSLTCYRRIRYVVLTKHVLKIRCCCADGYWLRIKQHCKFT